MVRKGAEKKQDCIGWVSPTSWKMDTWETHLNEGILLCGDTPSTALQKAGGEGCGRVLEQGQEKQADLEE